MTSEKITTDTEVISQTKQWINEVVIGLNFCPFAKRVFDKGLICYRVANNQSLEDDLLSLLTLCGELTQNEELETGFVIYPNNYADFEEYLDFLELANQVLIEQDYEGVYQLASFHPHYCFDGVDIKAAENFTNRSPYPMLHLLREESLEKTLEQYKEPDEIPIRNIQVATQKGVDFFTGILKNIKHD